MICLVTPMDFAVWLQAEMDRLGLDQSELARRSVQSGYPIAANSVSRILSTERQAGPDACISIAYALGIPREEVFRARGWLLRAPEEIFPPGAAPKLVALGRAVSQLPNRIQDSVLDAWEASLALAVALAGEPTQAFELDDLEEAISEWAEDEQQARASLAALLDWLKEADYEFYRSYVKERAAEILATRQGHGLPEPARTGHDD